MYYYLINRKTGFMCRYSDIKNLEVDIVKIGLVSLCNDYILIHGSLCVAQFGSLTGLVIKDKD